MLQITPPNLPPRLIQKIEAAQSEEDAYAADELVELGEEILSQLAAIGITVYLQQANQKDVYNDFLISLFLSNGHAYNAGPLYRWAANMIKDAQGEDANLLYPLFWETKEGKEVLREDIHHLASIRNSVMHGFFVLPPETNRLESKKMESILINLEELKLFEKNWGNFHFLDQKGFNGHWNITEASAWENFQDCHTFGNLAKRIAHEYSNDFVKEEREFAFQKIEPQHQVNQQVNSFIEEKGKGAFSIWYRPDDANGRLAYQSIVQNLDPNKFMIVQYVLNEQGASFTSRFMETEIGKCLYEETNDEKYLKDVFKHYKNTRAKLPKKLVIVLHDIHIGLFNPSHVLQLVNDLYELEIPIIATSWQYTYLNRFFNGSINIEAEGIIPSKNQLKNSLNNFLRFKGPSNERKEELEAYQQLEGIADKIVSVLSQEKKVIARRFADENNFPIEFVHECFSILQPFLNIEKEPFEKDEIDELYGFPIEIKESSRIFLTLGRRDVKLEYQHKVLAS